MPETRIDPAELRSALGTFMTGVTVVTTLDDDGSPRGFTANSFTSVSLEPPLVLVCVAHSAFSYPRYAVTEHFGINILAEEQRGVSGLFAGKRPDKFAQVNWDTGAAGSPVIVGSVAWIDCRVHERIEAGDHLILIGRVIDLRYSAGNPLGFCRGAYLTPALEQEAVPAPGQRTRVGAILECDGRVLLLEDPRNGTVNLPGGPRLGRADDSDSLEGQLQALSIDAEIGFIFAVFEDEQSGTLSVYYRGQLRRSPGAGAGVKLFEFDEIPWARLPDPAVRSMLQRYVAERLEDRFGIYVGDFDRGQVRALVAGSATGTDRKGVT